MNEPQSLRELVESAASRHQTSGRQLAFLAQKQGFTLATTTINAIRQGTYKSVPTDETIRAIAWLAGVGDEVAFTAAGQPVPGPPFAEELPPGVDNLPLKARKAAIDMLRVLVDMNKEVVGNGDHPTHMNQAGESPANPLVQEQSVPTGIGASVPHIGLTASSMLALAAKKHSGSLPSAKPLLADPEIASILKSELRKFTNRNLAEQFEQRVSAEFTRMVTDARSAPRVDPHAHPDADEYGHIPLPANYYELAADGSRNYGAEEAARASARGEETQDTEQD